MSGYKVMVDFRSILWVLLFSLLNPLKSAGQSLEWAVQPSVILDELNEPYQEIGPGISFSSLLSPEGRFAYGVFANLARTDFQVGDDSMHRNFASMSLDLRMMTDGDRARLALSLGLGISLFDDANETDMDFRSSANGAEMFVLGLEGQFPVTSSWGISVFARSQMNGWFYGLLSEEYGIEPSFLFGSGVYFR
jgi:hypothetical protein|tara:strand:- start:1824 stop:2402 length:579 start_codon:yes stop_codon:yes gene_type:complete